jgi:hypothetical protein
MAYSYQLDRGKELHGCNSILEEVHNKIFSSRCMVARHDHQREEFQLGKSTTWSFKELKRKINNVPILTMPNLQQPFELETNASEYALGVVLMQGGRLYVIIQNCFMEQFWTTPHMTKKSLLLCKR